MKINVVYIRDARGIERAVSVALFHNGRPYVASDNHPNFPSILDAIEQHRSADEVADMFDTSSAIARGFKNARRLLRSALGRTPEEHDVDVQIIDLTEGPDGTRTIKTLDDLGQRELQRLARQHGIMKVVGKTNKELREAIRAAQRDHPPALRHWR